MSNSKVRITSLVHELRERIATSPSANASDDAGGDGRVGDDDAVEARFRAVLPNLLHTYVVPSASSNEREVVAVLKLVSHTARSLPGVYYHGKATAVLPIIGRILPFFAEPSFSAWYGVIFEAAASLLSLLRTGDRDAYRQFFVDMMVCIEDILHVASILAKFPMQLDYSQPTLKCFRDSFTGIFDDPACLCALPTNNKLDDGSGLLLNLAGNKRWQFFACWMIKLLSKCLTDGTISVEGLVSSSFVSTMFHLLCYGDAELQMACFDFACICGSAICYDVIPHENVIRSILAVLGEDEDPPFDFRNKNYDASVGCCLDTLFSSCSDDVVRATASALIGIFHQSIRRTRSCELKVALCNAYVRIAKLCQPHLWKPESLVQALCSPESCLPLIRCLKAALSILGIVSDGGGTVDCKTPNFNGHLLVGEKRGPMEEENFHIKRRKVDMKSDVPDVSGIVKENLVLISVTEENYGGTLYSSILSFIDLLNTASAESLTLKLNIFLRALSMLSISFLDYSSTSLGEAIFQLIIYWIPLVAGEVKKGNCSLLDVSIYLEAIHCILLVRGSLYVKQQMSRHTEDIVKDLFVILNFPWTHDLVVLESSPISKTKMCSIQVISALGQVVHGGDDLRILDLCLTDESEDVVAEAVLSMPLIVYFSCFDVMASIFQRLEILQKCVHKRVKKIVPFCLGFLSCLYGSKNRAGGPEKNSCKMFLNRDDKKQSMTADFLLGGFWCSKCDKHSEMGDGREMVIHLGELNTSCTFSKSELAHFYSLFFELLNDEMLEEVQIACVQNIQRILVHMSKDFFEKRRQDWIKSIKYLLLCKKKGVREAFCSQISQFTKDSVLASLFPGNDDQGRNKEMFMNMIKQVLGEAGEPQVFETLLESVAELMLSVTVGNDIFMFSLILLVDQIDNPHATVRMNASRLIHKSCFFHCQGGLEEILVKFDHIRNELYSYVSNRLATRPSMVREFAEAVFGMEVEELLKKMVPDILPKLVVAQKDDDSALDTLYEMSKCLNIELVPLVVNSLPKVLAFSLQEGEQQLLAALQFYRDQTGSDSQEIFSAALPALLDELICFLDGSDSNKTDRRLSEVPRIIKKVSRILTGNEDLPSFLKNHFVGLLNSIDRRLLHSDDVLLQKQALRRIEMLISLMGCHLSTYVPKLMVLIMHALEKESLQFHGLSILLFFIQQLGKVSPTTIKHVSSQVFASLIPFIEREKSGVMFFNKVVEILEEIVLKHKKIIEQNIHEFPPLPCIPALEEVNKAIEEARGSMTLKDQLRNLDDGLNHENLNVRYMVACELCKLLNLRREEVESLISGEVCSDMDILSSLIRSLLRGCAEESRTLVGQRLKLVCADCIGALGAVDPAKVKGFSSQRFKIECSDDDLIFELIHKFLARAFRASSDTIIQDSAALAIQELLKFAGCEASLDDNLSSASQTEKITASKDAVVGSKRKYAVNENLSRGQKLWDRFSVYVKEIIAPCLTSRFQLPGTSESAVSGPIYRPSMSFRRWIYSWIKKLNMHASGPRVNIFNACRGIVRHDMPTAMYLLPYLVLNAVCHGSEEARHSINEEIMYVLDAAASDNISTVNAIHSGQSEVCIQAIFTLLDNLGQWADDVSQELALSQSLHPSASKQGLSKSKDPGAHSSWDPEQLQSQCKNVSELLAAISKVTLARASFRCQAYARALMYFESHVRKKSGSFNPAAWSSSTFEDADISYLMEIYSFLDEPDGLSGLACLRKLPSLQDQLLINKKAGNWAEVLTSCEQALQMEPTSVQRHSDVLNCLLNMCHLQAMVTHVDGLIARIPQYKKTWSMQGVQAAWRLSHWDLMDEYLNGAAEDGLICSSSESYASFDMDVAKILQAIMKKDQFSVAEKIALSKQALIAPLAAAGMDSHLRAYPYIVKLHFLRELEDFHSLLGAKSFLDKSFDADDAGFSKLIDSWGNRLKFTQPSLWAREPLLALRRLVFSASALGAEVGNCWLQYAKLCRLAGHYETANRAILEAQASGAHNVHMEKAKLLWNTRRADSAINVLQQSLLNFPVEVLGSAAISSMNSHSLAHLITLPNPGETQNLNENDDAAKTMLLYSRWIHYTGQKQKEEVISLYSRVKELQPKWEKGYFYLAKYCDEVLADARKRQEESSEISHRMPSASTIMSANSGSEKCWWSYLPDVLLFYAKGLHRGHKNLFQALPRLLTLWFDFGSFYLKCGSSANKDMKHTHGKVTSVMRGCLKDLPTYQWLTVLPQLVSRICHQNEEIVRLVKHIVTSVLRQYPQQALWIMAAVSKSTVPSRREAAAEIIQSARKDFSQGNGGNNLFDQFASLIDHLIKLCFHPGQPKAKTVNIATEFSSLKRMMPLDILMPVQQSLTVSLPQYDTYIHGTSTSDIFIVADLPTIVSISDEADILSSLQRPKKVVFLGSDGIERPFLCKPKDDLRKDARMMEFNAMINRLLSKSPESRRRELYIRTFAVIPLTEDCGMVEWVPHTRGLRHILQDTYIALGKFDRQRTNPQIKRIYDQCQAKMPEDEMLKEKILPMFPPVFHRWFLATFSEPAAWFRARIAYAHTTAVWSMVGHIVGLGDRHGENILLDSTTGDCVHVDFSCLFDKGLQLEKPELVPFRLTQNMIDGLGITGYEGIFLRVCEITLSVLRTNRETLMSVLETFLHDPLVEWTKSHKSSGVEVQNPHAQRAVNNIEARLQGVVVGVGAAPSLPLAVEGQARRLIAEAVSLKNLGKMYIWWMPWF
ncbi:hypothetical protein MLD38_023121 [Melastoma candidum]|uniref:Uncharacterized protein n=1 Tax=Melastoma candidum TaxID=119954 RepID=A0ACB9QKU6_9MYRT|nr:hypothetical protein MLD38_023121 [Melastoma candidum]